MHTDASGFSQTLYAMSSHVNHYPVLAVEKSMFQSRKWMFITPFVVLVCIFCYMLILENYYPSYSSLEPYEQQGYNQKQFHQQHSDQKHLNQVRNNQERPSKEQTHHELFSQIKSNQVASNRLQISRKQNSRERFSVDYDNRDQSEEIQNSPSRHSVFNQRFASQQLSSKKNSSKHLFNREPQSQNLFKKKYSSQQLFDQKQSNQRRSNQEYASQQLFDQVYANQQSLNKERDTQQKSNQEHGNQQLSNEKNASRQLSNQEYFSHHPNNQKHTRQQLSNRENASSQLSNQEHVSQQVCNKKQSNHQVPIQGHTIQQLSNQNYASQQTFNQEHATEKLSNQRMSNQELESQHLTNRKHPSPRSFIQEHVSQLPFDQKNTSQLWSNQERAIQQRSNQEHASQQPSNQEHKRLLLTNQEHARPQLSSQELPCHERLYQTLSNEKRNKQDYFNHTQLKPPCSESEICEVVFAKVHKAASSTMQNILLRFAMERDLDVLLPAIKKGTGLNERNSYINPRQVIRHPADQPFDILCNHIIYNACVIAHYFRHSAVRVAILREPMKQALSALAYYTTRFPSKSLTSGLKKYRMDPINGFLAHPEDFYDAANKWGPSASYINNRMSVDLGFDRKDFEASKTNKSKIRAFVDHVEKEFDLVLISDFFDESLILLRRFLRWPMKDIIYIKVNVASFKEQSVWRRKPVLNSTLAESFRHWDQIDYDLYEYFSQVFLNKIQHESLFQEEVKAFQNIQKAVKGFCLNNNINDVLRIQKGVWTDEFTVSKEKCRLMLMSERAIVTLAKQKQLKRYNQSIGMEHRADTVSPKPKNRLVM